MQNTILILTVFAIVIKIIFALGAKVVVGDVTQLMNISNLIIVIFAFIGLYCQWMWDRSNTTYEEV
jgi:hypothetical protein